MKHLMLFVKADYKKYLSHKKGYVTHIYGRKVVATKDGFSGVIDNDSILNFYNEVGYISHEEKNNKLLEIIKTCLLYGSKWKTKIVSIEYIGNRTVYDFYEPKSDDWNHEGYVSRGCSEIFGTTGVVDIDGEEKLVSDVCCLGSINIVKFYDVSTKTFNMDKFLDAAALMVKSLDNIIDISDFPLDEYKDGAYLKRKIGVGITGIGSLMMMMNTRYGSEECLVFLEDLMHKFMNKLYVASAMLAKEKGVFPLYNKKLLSGGYVKNSGVLTDDTINLIKKHGLRNSALCAFAPNGSLSILAGNVSGGLEPVFSKEHIRWNRVEGSSTPFTYPDVQKN